MDMSDDARWFRTYERQRYKYPVWSSGNGRTYNVWEINDRHLDNIIKALSCRKTKWLGIMQAEKRYRQMLADNAAMYNEVKQIMEEM